MRFNRLYTTDRLEPEQQVCLTGKPAHYLHRVLRLAIGDRIVLFNGDGWDYPATISSISKDQAMVQVSARLPAVPESALDIHLVQAVSRGERMDTSLQKATELGVSIIQPLITERVEVKLHGKRLAKRMQHWQGVIISACEQSGRAKLPLLQCILVHSQPTPLLPREICSGFSVLAHFHGEDHARLPYITHLGVIV